jgi:hypothetical protein
MKELLATMIVMATLLICSPSQAEPYNGPSVLMVFEKNLDRGFLEYENERIETWRECVLKMEAIQFSRGDGVTARCLPLHIEKEPEIVAEAQGYLTY